MALRERFISVSAALVAILLQAGATSAHAGEQHTTGRGLSEPGGIGLLAVGVIVSLAYGLANRATRRSPNVGQCDQGNLGAVPDSPALLTASRATHRSNVPTSLIAAPASNRQRGSAAQRAASDIA